MPKCIESHCDGKELQAQCWEVVKAEMAKCLQVDLREPASGYKVRAMAPLPMPVWVCVACGRTEKPIDMLAWAVDFVSRDGGRHP